MVTGASGELGRLVVRSLLAEKVPGAQIVAAVRSPEKAEEFALQGVQVRQANYADSASLDAAFEGASKVLLISSSNLDGGRLAEHRNVIAAAQRCHVQHLLYTSIPRAESSPLLLAQDHRATEAAIKESGLPFTFLRNGWYNENFVQMILGALARGAVIGAAGEGRYSTAPRADYAAAAAKVLSEPSGAHVGQVYELAGDESFSLGELAAQVSEHAGKTVAYVPMSVEAFEQALRSLGLPEGLAHLLADSHAGAAQGGLFDDSHTLSRLLGRATTPMAATVQALVTSHRQQHALDEAAEQGIE